MAIKIGGMLVKAGILTNKQLDEALKYQVIYGGKIGTNLIELGYIDESTIASFLSKKMGIPYADYAHISNLPDDIIHLLSTDIVEKYRVIPISLEKNRLTLAMSDPTDYNAIDEISFVTNFSIKAYVTPEVDIMRALEKYYSIKRNLRYISVIEKEIEKDLEIVRDPETLFHKGKSLLEGPKRDIEREAEEEALREAEETKSLEAKEPEKAPEATRPPEAKEPEKAPEATKPPEVKEPEKAPKATKPPEVKVPEEIWEEAKTPEIIKPPEVKKPFITPQEKEKPEEILDLEEDLEEAEVIREEVRKEIIERYSIDDLSRALAGPADREAIADVLIKYLSGEFYKAALFIVRGNHIVGWRASKAKEMIPDFEGLQLSTEEPSVLKTVSEGMSFYLGPIAKTGVNLRMVNAMGGGVPSAVLLVPVVIMGKVVNIIYVEGGSRELGDIIGEVQRLANKASMSFEILIFKNKIMMT